MITVYCALCERELLRHKYQVSKTRNFYCSRECHSKSQIGKEIPLKTRQKMSKSHKGKFFTKSHKDAIGDANRGKKKPPFSDEHRRKLGNSMRGKKHPIEVRLKIGKRGSEHWNWQGGKKPYDVRFRNLTIYKYWREQVFKRDGLKCSFCGSMTNLQIDHIKPFSVFKRLRVNVDNGRVLCFECHKKTNTYGVSRAKYLSNLEKYAHITSE